MPDEPQNFNVGGEPPSHQSLLNVPPPPPEVKVRTLRSDLESMAKSGGGAPQFQNVKAPSLANLSNKEKTVEVKKSSNILATVIAILVAIALVLAIAYFAYQIFFKSG